MLKLKSWINPFPTNLVHQNIQHSDGCGVTRLLARSILSPSVHFKNQAHSIFHILSESCDSVRTVTSEAAAKTGAFPLCGKSHVRRRVCERERNQTKTRQESRDGRRRENLCLHHVLGVLLFLLPLRSLMALQKLRRATRAISKVMVKLRRYHSLIDGKKQGKESEGQFYPWC